MNSIKILFFLLSIFSFSTIFSQDSSNLSPVDMEVKKKELQNKENEHYKNYEIVYSKYLEVNSVVKQISEGTNLNDLEPWQSLKMQEYIHFLDKLLDLDFSILENAITAVAILITFENEFKSWL